MTEERWFKWICVFLALASMVVLFQAANKIKVRNEAERDELRDRAAAYDEAMKPLLSEKRKIEHELTALEDEQIRDQSVAASVLFLCSEPDARIMTDIVPVLNDYSFPGLLAVSEDRFFGDEGCLTAAQANKLLQRGWELCISADAETDIGALVSRLAENGFPNPTAVYYPDGGFSEDRESALRDLGISTLICYGEKAESELWSIMAYGCYENDAKNQFLGAVQAGDSLVLTVGYSRSREKYEDYNFSSMLRAINSGIEEGAVYVRPLTEAYDCYMEYKNSDNANAFANRRSELERRLDEINTQLWEQAK